MCLQNIISFVEAHGNLFPNFISLGLLLKEVCFLGKHISFLSLQRKKINKEEDLLGCEVRSAFPQIQEIIEAKEPFDKLWRALVTFHDKQEMWLAGPILKLNAEEIEEEVFLKYIMVHVLVFPVTVHVLWSSSVLSVSRYALWRLNPGKIDLRTSR